MSREDLEKGEISPESVPLTSVSPDEVKPVVDDQMSDCYNCNAFEKGSIPCPVETSRRHVRLVMSKIWTPSWMALTIRDFDS